MGDRKMVKVRGSTILAAASGAQPMNKTGANAIQVYGAGGMFWAKKPLILRNAPYTIEKPHLGQAETRVHFAEIAHKYKGETGFIEGLPAVAWHIKQEMTGYRASDAMPKEYYPSKSSYHSEEELRRYIEKKKRERRGTHMGTPEERAMAGIRGMVRRI